MPDTRYLFHLVFDVEDENATHHRAMCILAKVGRGENGETVVTFNGTMAEALGVVSSMQLCGFAVRRDECRRTPVPETEGVYEQEG